MSRTLRTTLSAFSISLATLGVISVFALMLSVDLAVAKDNNSNNGNANRGNSANAGNDNGNRGASGNGNGASALGSLNAGHASEVAQEHANSNSRVGLIQAFEAAALAAYLAQTEYDAAAILLANFEDFETVFEDYSEFVEAYNADPENLEEELAYWQAVQALNLADSELHSSQEIEDMALQLAANQETDEATIERLWDLLGTAAFQ